MLLHVCETMSSLVTTTINSSLKSIPIIKISKIKPILIFHCCEETQNKDAVADGLHFEKRGKRGK